MKLLVVDGNSLISRAYYGVRPLTTGEGVFTNAVYGFAAIMLKMLSEINPDGVTVAFDLKKPTFRHNMYSDYKAGRHATPPELLSQFPLVREMCSLWGFRCVDCEGYEADDILGTLAEACRKSGDMCIIATGDRDSLQLIGGGVTVRLAKTVGGRAETEIFDENTVMENFGVTPRQLIDVKSIQGDASDNIPGVPGIGEVGAKKLIAQFGSLDGVYKNIDDPSIPKGMRKKLIEGEESARMSRILAEIAVDAPVNTDPASYSRSPIDTDGMRKFLQKLEMYSLIDRIIGATDGTASDKADADASSVPHAEPGLFAQYKAFTLSGGQAFAADENGVAAIDISALREQKNLITDDTKAAVAAGIPVTAIGFDTTLAAYLLNPSASDYSVSRLCTDNEITPAKAEGFDDNEAAERAFLLPSLADSLRRKIEENGMAELLYKTEIPLAGVLSEMERDGFEVDFDALTSFGNMLSSKITDAEQEIYALAGGGFNINSPKQLGEVLFERLGLPARKKTATGYSTDAAVLEELAYSHPVVSLILDYRKYAKLKSTYCDGLIKARGADGRIHSTYNQTETRTGRISSTEPNLQNIPVRSELGREMRRFFTAAEGWLLVDADYSQIELRVLAHLSADNEMCRAFNEGADIHTRTAAQVFGVPPELVTPQMRSRAKAVNFGIVYGIGAFSLAKDIHSTRKEAEEYIESYMRTFSGVKKYMDDAIAFAKEKGYAVTMWGRRRLLPELTASNFNTRSFGERVARNMPIQGAAADIIKLAMVRVRDRLKKENMASRLILQVHDELIVESPEAEAERAAVILREEMENVCPLRVPLVAETHIGKTWYDAK